jgi:molecular chaperone GrpE
MTQEGVDGRETGRPPDAEGQEPQTVADGSDQEQAADVPTEPAAAEDSSTGEVEESDRSTEDQEPGSPEDLRVLAEERLDDLQRLQAEYVNYRRRVERDRDVARDSAVATVLEALLPVLDDVHLARQHGDLDDGPFSAIAEKLETTLSRFGLARYGDPGEVFDPTVHEALMRTEAEPDGATDEPTVAQVLQPGYRAGERILRAARVAVADPG